MRNRDRPAGRVGRLGIAGRVLRPPEPVSAVVQDSSNFTVTFSRAVQGADGGGWSAILNGNTFTPVYNGGNDTETITLNSDLTPLGPGDVVTVSYSGGGGLGGSPDGQPVAAFADFPVPNPL